MPRMDGTGPMMCGSGSGYGRGSGNGYGRGAGSGNNAARKGQCGRGSGRGMGLCREIVGDTKENLLKRKTALQNALSEIEERLAEN